MSVINVEIGEWNDNSFSTVTWIDPTTGDLYQTEDITFNTERDPEDETDDINFTYEETTSFTGYNPETETYENGQVAAIQRVSDYLYYSLDSWGRANPTSEQP